METKLPIPRIIIRITLGKQSSRIARLRGHHSFIDSLTSPTSFSVFQLPLLFVFQISLFSCCLLHLPLLSHLHFSRLCGSSPLEATQIPTSPAHTPYLARVSTEAAAAKKLPQHSNLVHQPLFPPPLSAWLLGLGCICLSSF